MASKNKNKKKKSGAAQAQKSGIAEPQQTGGASAQQSIATQPQKTTGTQPQKSAGTQPQKSSKNGKSGHTKTQTNFIGRLIGVVTLKRAIYREIAEDPAATMQAAVIVVVVALVAAAVGYIAQESTALPGLPTNSPSIGRAIVLAVSELIIWVAGAFVIAQAARYLFRANTDTNEMLRVFGYSRVFQVIFILGVFSGTLAAILSIVGLVLSIVASVIGIREAGEITTGKAVITGVFAIVLVSILVAFFTAFVLNPFVTMLLPT